MLYFLHPFLGKEGIRMSQYIITDGSRFIFRNHFGKYVPTPSEAMADIYIRKNKLKEFVNARFLKLYVVYFMFKSMILHQKM